jgi:hypothetical protein
MYPADQQNAVWLLETFDIRGESSVRDFKAARTTKKRRMM